MRAKERIIVAVDVGHPDKALELVEKLGSAVGSFKIGLELMMAMLASIITAPDLEKSAPINWKIRELFRLLKGKVFWDGKFKDIPNTMAGAAKALGPVGVRMFNVHASAGIEGMAAAVAERGNANVLAVTVLTSMEENDAHLVYGAPSKAKVLQFARNAKLAGCQGIVCSPQELLLLGRQPELASLWKVIPGIRATDAPPDDQNRTMSPREAARNGADELVIGRPITQAKSPLEAVENIAWEVYLGLLERFHASLFDLKKIKFGAFKLKLHEKNPDAPLSPIYLNIRDLPDWMYTLAGDILHDLIVYEDIPKFDYVIGIPKAGEPIGLALAKAVGKPHLRIEKTEGADGRRITSKILDPFEKGKKVVLVDDLITKAETKREAIESVEANGLEVVATLVLYDREQGGVLELNSSGRKVVAMAALGETLDFFVRDRKIEREKKAEVMAYIKDN